MVRKSVERSRIRRERKKFGGTKKELAAAESADLSDEDIKGYQKSKELKRVGIIASLPFLIVVLLSTGTIWFVSYDAIEALGYGGFATFMLSLFLALLVFAIQYKSPYSDLKRKIEYSIVFLIAFLTTFLFLNSLGWNSVIVASSALIFSFFVKKVDILNLVTLLIVFIAGILTFAFLGNLLGLSTFDSISLTIIISLLISRIFVSPSGGEASAGPGGTQIINKLSPKSSKAGMVFLIIIIIAGFFVYSRYGSEISASSGPVLSGIGDFFGEALGLLKDPVKTAGDIGSFRDSSSAEEVIKKGIVFSESEINPVLPYYAQGSKVKIRAIGVQVDSFKDKQTQVKFGCKIKDGSNAYDGKAVILGKNSDTLKLTGTGLPVILNLECEFDETATSSLNYEDRGREYIQKTVEFSGIYEDFSTTSCIDIYNMKEGESFSALDASKTGTCYEGCGLSRISIETPQMPWVLPKGEDSQQHTGIETLTAAMSRDSSYEGNLLKVKEIKMEYDESIFSLGADEGAPVTSAYMEEGNLRIKEINRKIESKIKGLGSGPTPADLKFSYIFTMKGTSNIDGKLQATPICISSKYDHYASKHGTVNFAKQTSGGAA